jgi:hypothetical protein
MGGTVQPDSARDARETLRGGERSLPAMRTPSATLKGVGHLLRTAGVWLRLVWPWGLPHIRGGLIVQPERRQRAVDVIKVPIIRCFAST